MSWLKKLEKFCADYNIPIEYLADVLYEPKVIPMIRGKAFEFTVLLALQNILPQNEFEVTKVSMNAQYGLHDEDVSVRHIPTGLNISVECKLAAKGRYRYNKKTGNSTIAVKCMRSRTLGEAMIERVARECNLPPEQVKVHNDQYLPDDFDVVITSIGNAFYATQDELFQWLPTAAGIDFLNFLSDDKNDLKNFAFNQLYLAPTHALAINPINGILCTRGKCTVPDNCGFIPNYPIISFESGSKLPQRPWYGLENAAHLFRSVALRKAGNSK